MTPLEIVKSFYDAIAKADGRAALSLLAPSVEWTEAYGSRYYTGTWIGPDAVRTNLLERLGADWISFIVKPDLYVSEGSNVVAFGVYRGVAKTTDRILAAAFAHHWVIAHGKIISFRQFTDTASWNEVLEEPEPATDSGSVAVP